MAIPLEPGQSLNSRPWRPGHSGIGDRGQTRTLTRPAHDALDLVGLRRLMMLGEGSSDVVIGLLDGPVVTDHPDLASNSIFSGRGRVTDHDSRDMNSEARRHGTFIAGILSAKRGSPAPAICPGCTLLPQAIFHGETPSASIEDLAEAIVACVKDGARILNLSGAYNRPSSNGEPQLSAAIAYARQRGAVTVAAAGNGATIGGSPIISTASVLPVAACDLTGSPLTWTNLGHSVGRRGLLAPGVGVTSLAAAGLTPASAGGTSAATAFVTGAMALLWSLFPSADAAVITTAMRQGSPQRRRAIVPPLLNAWAAYRKLQAALP